MLEIASYYVFRICEHHATEAFRKNGEVSLSRQTAEQDQDKEEEQRDSDMDIVEVSVNAIKADTLSIENNTTISAWFFNFRNYYQVGVLWASSKVKSRIFRYINLACQACCFSALPFVCTVLNPPTDSYLRSLTPLWAPKKRVRARQAAWQLVLRFSRNAQKYYYYTDIVFRGGMTALEREWARMYWTAHPDSHNYLRRSDCYQQKEICKYKET